MAKKKIKGDGIYFLGQSSIDVTGSQYLVKFDNYKILLECGLHQSSSNDYLDSYKINSQRFKFNPNEIDYVFVAHAHIDHTGLLPRLVKEGFHGKIIATHNTAMVMKSLLTNCAHIVAEEAIILSKRYHRGYKPLFDLEDVFKTMELVYEYDEYDTSITLNENVSFQWLNNSHCIGATQLLLILKNDLKTKRILYTSDIGALHTNNHYVVDTEMYTDFADVVLMESTYGNNNKAHKKSRAYDLNHLQTAVRTVIDRNGSVVFPCFSFSRTQEILTNLYLLFAEDEKFNIPIVVDSMLSCEISKLYSKLLNDDCLDLWEKVYSWKNVRFITDREESIANLYDNTPKIIISSSGFCTNGRIIKYLKKHLKDQNSMIIFSGYVGDNPSYLSYKIKNCSNRSTISINKEKIPNKADCITLSTFSSHADFNDLLQYGSSLNTNKLILVHGSEESKKNLQTKLRDEISKNNKSYKVVCSNKDMVVHI